MLAIANIRGFTEMKGGKFYSDELGITKENAMTAEEFYKFAHSPEQITKFQEELIELPFYVLPIKHSFLFDEGPQFDELILSFINGFNANMQHE